MNDREALEKLRDFLTYEQGVTPDMTPAKHRDALAEQIGDAWKMVDDHLSAEREPEYTLGFVEDEERVIVNVNGVATYEVAREVGQKVGKQRAPLVRSLRRLDGGKMDGEHHKRTPDVFRTVRAIEDELKVTR